MATMWGPQDVASNSVIWAARSVHVRANTANRTALYGNTTSNGFINGITAGVFNMSAAEEAKRGGISGVTILTAGSGANSRASVTFSDPTGSGATATATMKVVSAAVANVGTAGSFVPGDNLTLNDGTQTVAAVLNVATTQVRTAVQVAGGSNYAPGDTIKLNTGTASVNAIFTVSTVSANAITSLTITNVGAFTANPTLTGGATAAVTGVGTSATVTVTMGIGSLVVKTAGVYTAVPTILNSTAFTGGTGTGAQIAPSMGVGNVTMTANGSNYSSPTVSLTANAMTGATGSVQRAVSEAADVAHTGWHLRTVGQGGRANRVFYECLVAGHPTTNATSDDAQLPQ